MIMKWLSLEWTTTFEDMIQLHGLQNTEMVDEAPWASRQQSLDEEKSNRKKSITWIKKMNKHCYWPP